MEETPLTPLPAIYRQWHAIARCPTTNGIPSDEKTSASTLTFLPVVCWPILIRMMGILGIRLADPSEPCPQQWCPWLMRQEAFALLREGHPVGPVKHRCL
ncbi:MAG: hypothetical protein RLZZ165_1607 [Bacteroidota bacterium]